jgi:spectinomycin phosphotransferase
MHAWNLLLEANDSFYIVDWDTLIYAPKERDLMFIGGGLHGNGHTPQQEASLFYQGYGPAQADPDALAYYRYVRMIEDIAVYCEQIFLTDAGGEDRTQAVENVKSIFLPGGPLQIARQADEPR